MRVLALAAVVALITCGTAWADETVTTATPADAHPPGAATAGTQAAAPTSIAADRPRDGGGVRMTACGPEGVDSAGVTETRPHGEISVGAGTHGYRDVGASVCQPLPNGGFIAVSGSDSRWGH